MVYEGKMVFSQFLELVSWKRFQNCVNRHRGDWKVKSFYCREFFRVMVFAQITGRSSLAEIVLCLKAVSHHLYHAGIRSTLKEPWDNGKSVSSKLPDEEIPMDF